MFKKHSIQVSLVKPQGTEDTDPDTTLADLAYIATETSKTVIKGVGALALSYVAADTARQIVIHAAQTYMK